MDQKNASLRNDKSKYNFNAETRVHASSSLRTFSPRPLRLRGEFSDANRYMNAPSQVIYMVDKST